MLAYASASILPQGKEGEVVIGSVRGDYEAAPIDVMWRVIWKDVAVINATSKDDLNVVRSGFRDVCCVNALSPLREWVLGLNYEWVRWWRHANRRTSHLVEAVIMPSNYRMAPPISNLHRVSSSTIFPFRSEVPSNYLAILPYLIDAPRVIADVGSDLVAGSDGLLVHLGQLALHGRQLSIGDNGLGDADKTSHNGENRYYAGSVGGYPGRPLLGSFLFALGGAPFIALAFYLTDKPRNQRDDWWLFWVGNGIGTVLIAHGVFLAIFGTWFP